MPQKPLRTHNGIVRKTSRRIPFLFPDGSEIEAVWPGPAQNEMLHASWPDDSAGDPAQSGEAAAIADVRDAESNEVRESENPAGPWMFFLAEAEPERAAEAGTGTGTDGSPWRIARVAPAGTVPGQAAYFRDARFALLGIMNPDGSISVIEPLTPPAAEPPVQGEPG